MEPVLVHDTVELKVGDRVPGFIFRDTAKQEISLKQFKGKYVVIDVWACDGVTLVKRNILL